MTTRTDSELIACYRSAIRAASDLQTLQNIADDAIGHHEGLDDIESARALLGEYLDEWDIQRAMLD